MKHELESIHFLRQLQKAKKLSLELAKKVNQTTLQNQNQAGCDSKKPHDSGKDFSGSVDAKAVPLKHRSPVRRRSFASSSRHSRSSRRFLLNSAAAPTSDTPTRQQAKEQLNFIGLQKFVEVEVDGHHSRINVFDRLEVVTPDEFVGVKGLEKEEAEKENTPKKCGGTPLKRSQKNGNEPGANSYGKLPQPSFTDLENYVPPCIAAARPEGYYRYIEKTAEELDEEVEYEMDCEDVVWLRLYNEHRQKLRQQILHEDVFEWVMDRLEKECHSASQSQCATSGAHPTPEDDDVVCAICLDGDCQNTNVILFCDCCNLAVHQECYGVPYVPEGQWLCSRCQAAPTGPISCVLCPVTDGAMKQTNRGVWSHILCALWIPEVGFRNIELLEPITKIEKVPPARRRLTCFICKQKGIGACIQCMRKNCFTAFHVTCAQRAGIYMTIEPTHNEDGTLSNVHKTLLCNRHKPANARPFQPMYDSSGMETDEDRPLARSKSRSSTVTSGDSHSAIQRLPPVDGKQSAVEETEMIPEHRLMKIIENLKMKDRASVMDAIRSYWRLKRKARNDIPILRRLQVASLIQAMGMPGVDDSESLSGLKDLKKLRHDFEKVRLLLELVRKREKLKLEQVQLRQKSFRLELEPFNELLRQTLRQLQAKDRSNIFAFPVPVKELPDYASKIKHPMDFTTMKAKIDRHAYCMLDEFIADFELIVDNCMSYNAKHTIYHKAALRLKHQAEEILLEARDAVNQAAFCPSTGLHTSATESPNGISGRKRLCSSDHNKQPMLHEDRRSSERVKMPTRRYLIDDEIAPAPPNISRKRQLSTDSEEPPVLSRCPSPVEGVCLSLPPVPRKRSRLGSSHKDPPLLVKSAPCLQSHDPPSNPVLDDSLKSGSAVDSSGVILPAANDPGGSGSKSERAGASNPKDSERTTQEQSQKSKSEISGSRTAGIEDDKDPDGGRNRTGAIAAAVESSNAVSVVSESECSDSLSGNSFPPSSYLKALESMKADSAYSSASCSSSDSDNCDKR